MASKQKGLDRKRVQMANASGSCLNYLKFPSLWTSYLTLDQSIDTPVHQIFQGMVKSLMEYISTWLRDEGINSLFMDLIEDKARHISRLNLSWCKIERFTSKKKMTGGWLAEHYLGYSRLLLYWYQHIPTLCAEKLVDPIPVERLIQASYSCLCRLMTKNPQPTNVIDDYIKVFLSCVDEVSEDKQNPWWWRKGNIVSFLNFRKQIDVYGHLRLYWEGNRERFIQSIKPLLKGGRESTSYLKLKLEELYKITSFREMLSSTNIQGQWTHSPSYTRHKPIYCYPSYEALMSDISDFGVFCGFTTCSEISPDPVIFVCVQGLSANIELYAVKWSKKGRYHMGIWYQGINISVQPTELNEISCLKAKKSDILAAIYKCAVDYILCLSLDICSNGPTHMYAAITSNWLVHEKSGGFVLPNICSDIFEL